MVNAALVRVGAIPHGYGFHLVTCPNYTFEILTWGVVAALTNSWVGSYTSRFLSGLFPSNAERKLMQLCGVAWGFVALSSYQMTLWAMKKHRAYKKEFGAAYPKKRKVIVPFLF